jgi:subtilisin
MRYITTLTLAIAFVFSSVFLTARTSTPVQAQMTPEEMRYEMVVELDRGSDPERLSASFLSELGITDPTGRLAHVYRTAIVGFSVYLTEDEIAKARRLFDPFTNPSTDRGIQSMTLSSIFSTTPITGIEGEMPESRLDPNTQVVPTGIQRIAAPTDAADGVDVAVVDTGVDARHPDLNVVGGIDCTAPYGEEGDYGTDGYGHGTHVAGTIGAADNGTGVVGVAPGARIHSVKVLDDSGSGTLGSVICGIDWVAQNTGIIEVANMSLGGQGFLSECGGPDPMHNAICVATEQTVFVVAAGNSSQDALAYSPANYPEVVTVSAYADFDGQDGGAGMAPMHRCAAMSVDDELATFSNYGADVDISAPGTCIFSTLPGELNGDGGYTPLYGFASGTSMAAPHVAGAVARYLAANPDQRAYAIEQILTWSAANGGPVKGDHDMIHEPLLFIGTGAPRFTGPESDF